ncbi:MAG TPA: OmpW family outer membrane protein [Thermoanaerobaculia bacterium]
MKRLIVFAIVAAGALPVFAQRRVDLIVDAEGVRRSSAARFEPNVIRFDPHFDTGGGVGGGINFFLTDRVSFEAKVAALESHLRIRSSGSDFVSVADLGRAQIYPITALLQWHMLEHAAIRPYVGAGVGHVIVRNIEKKAGSHGCALPGSDGTRSRWRTGALAVAKVEHPRRCALHADRVALASDVHRDSVDGGNRCETARGLDRHRLPILRNEPGRGLVDRGARFP